MTAEQSRALCGDERSRQHAHDVRRRVGDAWSLALMARLVDGPRRFTELLRGVEGIAHRMLTQTLRSLERDGLVSRTQYREVPPRVEYALTSLGRDLLDPVLMLVTWAEDAQGVIDEHRERFDARRRGGPPA